MGRRGGQRRDSGSTSSTLPTPNAQPQKPPGAAPAPPPQGQPAVDRRPVKAITLEVEATRAAFSDLCRALTRISTKARATAVPAATTAAADSAGTSPAADARNNAAGSSQPDSGAASRPSRSTGSTPLEGGLFTGSLPGSQYAAFAQPPAGGEASASAWAAVAEPPAPARNPAAPNAPQPHAASPAQGTRKASGDDTAAARAPAKSPQHQQQQRTSRPGSAGSAFIVDADLASVWRSVVNPADPLKAASNLEQLLGAERAVQVASEFLALPGHVDVIRRLDNTKGRRSLLAHHVLATLQRRLSAAFCEFAPPTVALAVPDPEQEAADKAAAPHTLAKLISAELVRADVAEAALRQLLNDPASTAAALHTLELASIDFRRVAAAERPRRFDGLQDVVFKRVARTSHIGLTLAEAFAWTRLAGDTDSAASPAGSSSGADATTATANSSNKHVRPCLGRVLRPVANVPGPSDELCMQQVVYCSSADTVFGIGDPAGVVLLDSGAVAAAGGTTGYSTPSVQFTDRRFVAVDHAVKRDSVLALTGPPDVPVVYTIDVKTAAAFSAGSSTTTGAAGGQPKLISHTFALMDVDTATTVKALGYRTAACAVGVKAEKQHAIRLYTASGASDRVIGRAHEDYVTCLGTSPDNDSLLFSGGRDAVVKCWDLRASNPKATALKGAHCATISAIAVAREVVLCAGLDGRLTEWDARKLSAPLATIAFSAPLLGLQCHAAKGMAVVSTTEQLAAVSLYPFAVVDSVDSGYSGMTFGGGGDAVFAVPAAARDGLLHAFALGKPSYE